MTTLQINPPVQLKPIMPVFTSVKIRIDWNFTVPDDTFQVLLLYTITGIAVTGLWQGELGQYFVAWSLPTSTSLCGQLH